MTRDIVTDEAPFAVGQMVRTRKGAEFWGRVEAVYDLGAPRFEGEPSGWRCDVRAVAPGFRGTIHVYPATQLVRREDGQALADAIARAEKAERERNVLAHDWAEALERAGRNQRLREEAEARLVTEREQGRREGHKEAAKIADRVEVQQYVDLGNANSGGAAAAAAAIRALHPEPQGRKG